MQNKEHILEIRDLVTSFASDGKRDRAIAVNGVSIDIPRGKTVGVVGESGCGKSVTALSVMGLLADNGRVDSGEIWFADQNLLSLPDRKMREIRGNRISMIFQEPMTSLNPVVKVGKQVCESLLLHSNISREEAKARAIDIFRRVGIPEPEQRFDSYPHQLSGGLRQRVMIGMAMVLKPDLLIADEPTTALDVSIEAQIIRLMRDLQRENDTSIMMITHNLGVVAEICDEVYVMYAGEVVEHADVFSLYARCAHPYTRGLMASLPRLKLDQRDPITGKPARLYNIKGTVPNLRAMPKGCRFSPRCDYARVECANVKPPLNDIGGGHVCRCLFPLTDGGDRI